MRYVVTTDELTQVESYGPQDRLQYCLNRIIEAEEVWGLSNQSGWVMKEIDNQIFLPIWPYEQMATGCAINEWQAYRADAISLDYFVYKLLPVMMKQDINAEILPSAVKPGERLAAGELAAILDGMMESGEYYMEG